MASVFDSSLLSLVWFSLSVSYFVLFCNKTAFDFIPCVLQTSLYIVAEFSQAHKKQDNWQASSFMARWGLPLLDNRSGFDSKPFEFVAADYNSHTKSKEILTPVKPEKLK